MTHPKRGKTLDANIIRSVKCIIRTNLFLKTPNRFYGLKQVRKTGRKREAKPITPGKSEGIGIFPVRQDNIIFLL